MKRLLIANRGEIAIRIARTAALMGIETVVVAPGDDRSALHMRRGDRSRLLPGQGAQAYLDIEALVAVALDEGCEAVHPGYGFLSESAKFASACRGAGLIFVGPEAEHLRLFGDKSQARALAKQHDIPLPDGASGGASLEEVRAFVAGLGAGEGAMIKAVAGGGGRGMRAVRSVEEVEAAYARCASEAAAAFGSGELYAERLISPARHVEVQIVGDGGGAIHLWDRDCTLQRRHQKLVEIAPARDIDGGLRQAMRSAALTMAAALGYRGLATFEFLVEPSQRRFYFMEVNPRLQVEHTITEQITGLDLVEIQLRLSEGATLQDLGLSAPIEEPALSAMQLRVNAEEVLSNGDIRPASSRIAIFEAPGGPGVRVDSCAFAGCLPNPAYDNLIAKLIVTAPAERLAGLAADALRDLRIEGLSTNIPLLAALVERLGVAGAPIDTAMVERDIVELMESPAARKAMASTAPGVEAHEAAAVALCPEGQIAVNAPMTGILAALLVEPGEIVARGQPVAVVESMKVETVITTDRAGKVVTCLVSQRAVVEGGHPLIFLEPRDDEPGAQASELEVDLDEIRPDLRELLDRREQISDAGRPEAVARRRKLGRLTARESIAAVCDPDSFQEYGSLMLAAQRGRRSLEELKRLSPADGTITGTATVNRDLFPDGDTRCAVMAYDYTVFAGTQGFAAHYKMDRMFELAEHNRLPFILFAEGGGGRPGDTDFMGPSGLDLRTFRTFGKMAGTAPLVGVVSGRCFAGNAALLGCCHVIIGVEGANIGMAGPAMIEAGGIGSFKPEDVGPLDVQYANGVVDIRVADDLAAAATARRYLSYFQGRVASWSAHDQRRLRHAIPANRLRTYEIRDVIELIADEGSVLELRAGFGQGIVTALCRIEGRPLGLFANNPMHLGGAIDAEGADKAARFLQLCDAFDLPVLSLCDTPGFMVGPDAERTATVRHFARLFLIGGQLRSPFVTVILRKAYGLGSQAMAAGAFLSGQATFAWPSGELGSMGIEGAVQLAYRREMDAMEDPEARRAFAAERAERLYTEGRAASAASYYELDEVIDPMETRLRVLRAFEAAPPRGPHPAVPTRFVDAW